MPALLLDRCCRCIELRMGSLILGYLELVGSIIFIIMLVVGLFAGTTKKLEADTVEMDDSIFMLVILFLSLLPTIVLLIGVHQNKRWHVKASLIISSSFLVIKTLRFAVHVALVTGLTAGTIVLKFIILFRYFYFLFIVRSYFYKMDDDLTNQKSTTLPEDPTLVPLKLVSVRNFSV